MLWAAIIIIALLLLTIAAELGLIMFWSRRKLSRLPEHLSKAREDALAQIQLQRDEGVVQLADKLSLTLKPAAAGPSAGTPTTNPEQEETYGRLLEAVRELHDAAGKLKTVPAPSSEDVGARIAELTERFEGAVQSLGAAMRSGVEEVGQERQRLLAEMGKQFSSQQAELRTTLQELRATLRQVSPPARSSVVQPPGAAVTAVPSAVEPAAPVAVTASVRPPAEAAPAEPVSVAAPAQESAAVGPAGASFESLQLWVVSHLEQIMNRSLNRWSKPEDLLHDAPADLSYTTRLLDPDAKLVLIGLEGDPHYLALALPGGNIDQMYVEWFSNPQGGGGGGRVERTITPALLEGGATGYRVVRRGVVKPD